MGFWTFLVAALVAAATLVAVRRLAPAGAAKQIWKTLLAYGIACLIAGSGIFALVASLRR